MLLALVVGAVACSSSAGDGASHPDASTTAIKTTTTVDRPAGPAADLADELTGGKGAFIGSSTPDEHIPGYVEHEYAASGTATSYQVDGEQGRDGRWAFSPAGSAGYRTRILVRRPQDPADFSGTVVVEWLNVSGGVDAGAEWMSVHEELVRNGDIWVGVSAQQLGVVGGPILVAAPGGEGVAGMGLKKIDPVRYGTLEHPGDGYSFDIFTQVARGLREGGDPVGGVVPQRVLAVGESQSAYALTTYANGVQPLTKEFDGFLLHSRGASGLPVVGDGKSADLATALGNANPTIIRTDLGVPVMDLQAESDLTSPLNSLAARQPDSDTFRLWEVAGTAHADKHTLGESTASQLDCGVPINDGPLHLVSKAALRALDTWVEDGDLPPTAPRIEVTGGEAPAVVRDRDGIAEGGIRTPLVDVPTATLSGVAGPKPSTLCLLLGSTTPFTPERIAELYATPAEYTEKFGASADKTIAAGFVLADDKPALLAYADPSAVG